MEFEYDPVKAKSNLRKHRIAFEEASTVFIDPLAITVLDSRHSESEVRFVTIGHTIKRRLVVVAHTDRGNRTRIISARRATRNERKNYEEGEI
jgi:uncharacterized DUF497 family protein